MSVDVTFDSKYRIVTQNICIFFKDSRFIVYKLRWLACWTHSNLVYIAKKKFYLIILFSIVSSILIFLFTSSIVDESKFPHWINRNAMILVCGRIKYLFVALNTVVNHNGRFHSTILMSIHSIHLYVYEKTLWRRRAVCTWVYIFSICSPAFRLDVTFKKVKQDTK